MVIEQKGSWPELDQGKDPEAVRQKDHISADVKELAWKGPMNTHLGGLLMPLLNFVGLCFYPTRVEALQVFFDGPAGRFGVLNKLSDSVVDYFDNGHSFEKQQGGKLL